jgi:tetratricopeptide (TPR) repeat protein
MPRALPNPGTANLPIGEGNPTKPFQFATRVEPLRLVARAAKRQMVHKFLQRRVSALTRARTDACLAFLLLSAFSAMPAGAAKLTLPPETPAILEKIYSFDIDGAVEAAKRMEAERPEHPLGYLLEAEALWWRIWCTSAEFKYGMSDARHRPKLEADQRYFQLAAKASSLAEAQIKQHETAEMQFYAGMADAAAARLYGLRWENRNTARAGVRGREHLLRARTVDPGLADADMGLGLYNYYVDTLSAMARVLRFLMGIPGGSKQEGVRLLEQAIGEGLLTSELARFYLAMNLHRYDEQYEKALAVIGPLAEKYPANPIFQLARGDLYAKLGRKEKALPCYRAAASLKIPDAECQAHVRELARVSITALGEISAGTPH